MSSGEGLRKRNLVNIQVFSFSPLSLITVGSMRVS